MCGHLCALSHLFIQQSQVAQCYLANVMQRRGESDGPTLKDSPVRYNNTPVEKNKIKK